LKFYSFFCGPSPKHWGHENGGTPPVPRKNMNVRVNSQSQHMSRSSTKQKKGRCTIEHQKNLQDGSACARFWEDFSNLRLFLEEVTAWRLESTTQNRVLYEILSQ